MMHNAPDLRVLENIVPSAMVDAKGDLYFIIPHMGKYFAAGFWIGKVLANKDNDIKYEVIWIDEHLRKDLKSDKYYWSYDTQPQRPSDAEGATCRRLVFSPCIAQETSFSENGFVIFCVPSSRFWNKYSSGDIEGVMLSKFNKSDFKLTFDYFLKYHAFGNVRSNYFQCFSLKTYNRNTFTAIYDPSSAMISFYWLHKRKNSSTPNTDKVLFQYAGFKDDVANSKFTKVYWNTSTNSEDYLETIVNLEPRITKIGNEYHFMVSNGIYPQWHKASVSTGDTTWHEFNPHTYTLLTSDCCYHTDMQVMQHNGKNLALVMSLVKISHMTEAGISADSKKRWADDKFVPWNKDYIALVISSWYEGSGYTNIDIPPDNIIEVFPVSTASNAETTSTSTLYKNTHKFVTYTKGADNYIIYSYCYPGKSTQLYLGICRYWFDSNGHVHLYTKREFRNEKGESFGNLTNCSRICSMDTRNGHLWITFATANNKQFCYFHARTDDIVKFAP